MQNLISYFFSYLFFLKILLEKPTQRDPNIDDKIFPPNTNITIYLEIEPETRLLIEYNST